MEATFSNDFKKVFLLTFTKELIRHSEKRDILKLQKIIELKEGGRKKIPASETIVFKKETLGEISKSKIQIEARALEKLPLRKSPVRQFTRQVPRQLFIPEPKLPEHLEYLKPIPTPGVEIDLFKINPLIKDSAVRIIEANPEERVTVTGTMGTKPTGIILSKEDIDRIINKFSEFSKIPVTEGIYRVVVGNLILSAIISENIGSRFTIKKMTAGQNPANRPQLPTLPFQDNNLKS